MYFLSDKYWCFFAPLEARRYTEQMFKCVVKPGTVVVTDGHRSYFWLANIFKWFSVIHKIEFVTSDGIHTNKVEGRNNLIKLPVRGPLYGGTTNPNTLPYTFDLDVSKQCSFTWV
eukprot:TRINITY_DN8467_c0_g1_i1.p1 TRINITY_DN8467_c0_g1~~TRINITY_DN8467_c0_g1_i1.p1  ORF type:complete len:115 (-),score=9.95 TRINITY_DN8467_c0_g1_i1:75-419(-)